MGTFFFVEVFFIFLSTILPSLSSSESLCPSFSDPEFSLLLATSSSSFSVHFFTFFYCVSLLSAGSGILLSHHSGFLKVFSPLRFHSFPGAFLHTVDLCPLKKTRVTKFTLLM